MDDEKKKELYNIERERVGKIFQASLSGNVKALELVLSKGERNGIMEFKDSNGRTVLHFAASKGHLNIFSTVFSYLKDNVSRCKAMHLKDVNGDSSLALAVRAGYVDVVTFCLEYDGEDKGTFTNSTSSLLKEKKDAIGCATLLHEAAQSANIAMVKLVLSRGKHVVQSEINYCSEIGTPLFWTAFNNDPDTCELLLAAGANPEYCESGVRTPLLVAAACNAALVVEVLLKFGTSLELPSCANEVSVLHTSAFGGSVDVVNAILRISPKEEVFKVAKLRGKDGFTPEEGAAFCGHASITEIIGRFLGRTESEIEQILLEQQQTRKDEQNAAEIEFKDLTFSFEETKTRGNNAFQSGELKNALALYTECLQIAEKLVLVSERIHSRLHTEATEGKVVCANEMLAVLRCNRSACYLKLGEGTEAGEVDSRDFFKAALMDAEKATKLRPKWSKAFYRLGLIYNALGDYADAAQAFWSGYEIDPKDSMAKSLLHLFQKAVKAGKEKAMLSATQGKPSENVS